MLLGKVMHTVTWLWSVYTRRLVEVNVETPSSPLCSSHNPQCHLVAILYITKEKRVLFTFYFICLTNTGMRECIVRVTLTHQI